MIRIEKCRIIYFLTFLLNIILFFLLFFLNLFRFKYLWTVYLNRLIEYYYS